MMTIGIIGRKVGMSRLFVEDGRSIPVTVVEVPSNCVAHIKTVKVEGYNAVQVVWGDKKDKKQNGINKPQTGFYAKHSVGVRTGILEYRLSVDECVRYQQGDEIKVDMFSVGEKVDVTGVTIGKGFAGVIKRHNFSSQRFTHGNSLSHRSAGSIGQCQTPGRVFKGKKMAGHLGNKKRTLQNLEIVKIDEERNLLLIKGGVPACRGGKLMIKPAIKQAQH